MSQRKKNTGKTLLGGLLAIILAIVMMLAGGDLDDLGSDDLTSLPPDTGTRNQIAAATDMPAGETETIRENGEYSSKSEVGRYLYLYGKLPGNFITKDEASDLGWDNKKGNLWEVAPGKSIGGDRFGNYEGLLPKGKTYYECDINYKGGYRGSERIVYSADGYIYYTADHYESFEQLYP